MQREAKRETERNQVVQQERRKVAERNKKKKRRKGKAEDGAGGTKRGVFVSTGDKEGSDRWDMGSRERQRDRILEEGSWRNRE